MRIEFGFLYNGYRLNFFYWLLFLNFIIFNLLFYRDFLILLRLIVLILLFTSSLKVELQLIFGVLLMKLAIFWQKNFEPFSSSTLNKLEIRSLQANFITVFFSLFFQQDLIPYFRIVCTIIVLFANLFFLLNIIVQIIFLLRARKIVSKIFSYLKDNVSSKPTSLKRKKLRFSMKNKIFKPVSFFEKSKSEKLQEYINPTVSCKVIS